MLCEFTNRGFQKISFTDERGASCSIQQSSAWLDETSKPGESALWLGMGEHRMHLDRDRTEYLIEKLTMFLRDGNLFERKDGE